MTIAPTTSAPETSAPDVLLELDDVTISHPRPGEEPLEIVSGYDLAVRGGELHCVAGRSGSGKTSVLRVAAGLARPASGTVRWAGQALDGLSDDKVTALRRARVGYLDQGGALVDGMTALENVLLPAVPDRRVRALHERARSLLDELGVGAREGYRPARLSGGERQRVALARALLLEPGTVLADEPTASLDRVTADEVVALLCGLAERGIAVLVASHDRHLIDAAGTTTELA
ncbi:ABC transporter ATP-binding protein [Antribacter gilvus]|uniref:ABC transporter ATP-binding protein n=1 Tax=Antribacter gilvus TaxID=2304675 RepID=UPI000F7A3DA0|nr:ATP-binding cassette domain-containing protein [Antribacter gilvus]